MNRFLTFLLAAAAFVCSGAEQFNEGFERCKADKRGIPQPIGWNLDRLSKNAAVRLVRESGCGFVVPTDSYRAVGDQVLQDPMVGFGTTREEDVAILGSIRHLAAKAPVLVGASRKRVIGVLTGEENPAKRLGGSVGAAVWCAMCGASVVRVHDVKETKQALAVAMALANAEGGAGWTGQA